MAVLIEATSIIVPCHRIHAAYPGGWRQFISDAPRQTLCWDDEIVRIGFMAAYDVQLFVTMLEKYGLVFEVNGKSGDIASVDQQRGFNTPCDWLEFGRIELSPGKNVAMCRLSGSSSEQLATPSGWVYENSLSHSFSFYPNSTMNSTLKFLRHQNGIDIYYDILADHEAYVMRW